MKSKLRNFILLSIFLCVNSQSDCGKASYTAPFIIGGTSSEKNQWPWLSSLFFKAKNQFFCGASLINPFYLLSGIKYANFKKLHFIFIAF